MARYTVAVFKITERQFNNKEDALEFYNKYVKISKSTTTWASGRSVSLFKNNQKIKNHFEY